MQGVSQNMAWFNASPPEPGRIKQFAALKYLSTPATILPQYLIFCSLLTKDWILSFSGPSPITQRNVFLYFSWIFLNAFINKIGFLDGINPPTYKNRKLFVGKESRNYSASFTTLS